ncbi:MAG: TRAM domain-containing protein [Candidatus Diapherotrites archaeon]|uniref:TRAM domain-containing protein n=1 Tax=Candidatus Iainarchaeum sp. TaxID=3101447 RepID=A0A7J4IU20_9ARCH|nr:MAG: deoxyribonuclease/rho motif-related TRAM [archaeon GW2011_AR10]MBS3059522.1 TRAM domain-containing protein [Candidatus Diapherotrites archaeon]HIH09001.1 TRAM domain-containing protein [Candidatus Diapherotrites archaeon]
MAFSKYNDLRFRKPVPVKEGQEYDVEIESVGEKGDGIAKIEGFVVIVPNTKKGDKVKVKINAVRGKVSFGEVVGKKSAASAPASKAKGSKEPEEESEEAEEDFSSEDDFEEESKE